MLKSKYFISVPNNLTKVATVDPREIKKIGADTHRLPLEIEIENPYRDAVILNEMAKATSKDEVSSNSPGIPGTRLNGNFRFLKFMKIWKIYIRKDILGNHDQLYSQKTSGRERNFHCHREKMHNQFILKIIMEYQRAIL